ncbi:MAG: hypothetical protein KOO62_10820 [candidate division Zixibacteria bacterium]|nr:hypothetical protein [candidate division Zixibacteria bacterium]
MNTSTFDEQKWQEILAYLRSITKPPIRDRRIRAILVNPASHWQPKMFIEVGHSYGNLEADAPIEKVVGIFESTVFFVCTDSRGAGKGIPYYFSREDIRRVELWDSPPNT